MMKPGILLTRSEAQNRQDSQWINLGQYAVYSVPLLETRSLGRRLTSEELSGFDWLFFTSSNAVHYFYDALSLKDRALLARYKIAVIGEKTAEKVRSYGLTVTFIPSQYASPVFIEEWLNRYGGTQGQRILLPKSDLARSNIKQALVARGLNVTEEIIYQNILPESSKQVLRGLLSAKKIKLAIFSCPSAWHRYREVSQQLDVADISFGAIGPVTQQAIEKTGQQAVIPGNGHYTMDALLESLLKKI